MEPAASRPGDRPEVELPERVGGRLSLDFLNTVDPRFGPDRREYLSGAAEVLAWAVAAGVLTRELALEVAAVSAADPAAANAAHARVLAFREALHEVFSAALAGVAVDDESLRRVNAVLREATGHHVLVPAEVGGVRDGWVGVESLDAVLWPVAVDAWDLLTEPPLARVRECPGDDGACGWLFLDTSRSGTRRWCDMRTCGNRAKARAHYSRQRG